MAVDIRLVLAGIAAGVVVLLVLRANQVWRYRQTYGYDTYTADQIRRRLLRWGLAASAVTILIAVTVWVRIQMPEPETVAEVLSGPVITPTPQPVEHMSLLIPSLGLESQLEQAPIVGRQWDVTKLRENVAHLEGTAYPGEPGNTVLAGHITIPDAGWGPFQELETLEIGHLVFIRIGETETYTYEVVDEFVVPGTAIEIAYPTEDERLTLITCTGWNGDLETYTDRFVVVARRVAGDPASQGN